MKIYELKRGDKVLIGEALYEYDMGDGVSCYLKLVSDVVCFPYSARVEKTKGGYYEISTEDMKKRWGNSVYDLMGGSVKNTQKQ